MGSRAAWTRVERASRLGAVAAGQAVRTGTNHARAKLAGNAAALDRDAEFLDFIERFVRTVGNLKGASLKLGQLLALHGSGLSSPEARAEFDRLMAPVFDSVPPVSTAAMRSALRRELGPHAAEVEIDDEPIAAASIGQVYRGTYRGNDVAVKIQYPGISARVTADLKNLALLGRSSRRAFPGVDLPPILDEVSRQISQELDYVREAENQLRAQSLAAGHPVWRIPTVFSQVSGRRVLISEYLPGTPFEDLRTLDVAERDRIGEAVYRFYSGGVNRTGEFCADPHPGNILLLEDGRLGFLDFGLYTRMPADAFRAQKDLLIATMEQRTDEIQRLLVAMGFLAPDAGPRRAERLLDLMTDVAGWYLTEDPVTVTDDLAQRATARLVAMQRGAFDIARYGTLTPEHVFARRTEVAMCSLLSRLEATGSWGAIVREWCYDLPPTTPMGAEIARWEAARA
ncbi:ABC1 kinase family protein [Gordonia shandongensis]|uniref:ABC1 kinase family protein n=1 Tax=Gordonia shandongensis TaxID=376351 RepID=UPI00040F5A58|nr:AarF/ABC1/UbiB kinase family protein [Gordonia shandongensis]